MNRWIMLMFYGVIAGLMTLTSSTITFVDSNELDFTDCKYGAWLANRFISEGECVSLYANGGMIWDLAQDFRTDPDQENPNPDSNGNEEVWHFMYNPNNLVHNPLNYEYLNGYSVDGEKNEGWDDGVPEPSGTSIPLVRLIMDNYISMHPDYNQIVIVRWRSPISGIVKIRGGFRHVGGGGAGVAWFVDKTTEGDGVVSLASGTIDVDFSADFGPDFSVEVNVGDFIDFIIDPRGSSDYDSTLLELTIFGPVSGTPPSSELPPSPVNILGPEEIVFDWTTDRCETEDVPDLPARAFRDADGKVQLIATSFINRRMIGDDLASVKHDCNVIMASDKDADPSKYNDMEWISALYTLDGVNIHVLVHNEYQGNNHPGMCHSGEYFDCWYNSITYALSTDKGQTYTHAPAPQHRVANLPYKYVDGDGPYGIFAGSNIIRNPKDGYYYSLLHIEAEAYSEQDWGVGVMRTQTLDDPASWRCWDGERFNTSFIDPYAEENYDPADHICEPVSRNNIEKMHSSLTYNTYFNKFLLVGAAYIYDPDVGEVVTGFCYSLSDDLINWSPRQLIMKRKLWWTPSLPGDSYGYPSLIDPDDDSMNFEYTDKKVYLYYTRWHTGTMWDRDLVRIPIEFTIKDSAFSAVPTRGKAPLKVQFSDWSTGDITSWSWNFGDGSTSTEQNPIHTYANSGTYTVSLSVWWSGGSDAETKTDYIKVGYAMPWIPLLLLDD